MTIRARGWLALLATAGLVTPVGSPQGSAPRPAETGGFVIEVPGIPGPYCAYGIEKRLREKSGVAGVVTDWDAEELRVRTTTRDISAEDVRAAVEASQYPYDYTVR